MQSGLVHNQDGTRLMLKSPESFGLLTHEGKVPDIIYIVLISTTHLSNANCDKQALFLSGLA